MSADKTESGSRLEAPSGTGSQANYAPREPGARLRGCRGFASSERDRRDHAEFSGMSQRVPFGTTLDAIDKRRVIWLFE